MRGDISCALFCSLFLKSIGTIAFLPSLKKLTPYSEIYTFPWAKKSGCPECTPSCLVDSGEISKNASGNEFFNTKQKGKKFLTVFRYKGLNISESEGEENKSDRL